MTFLVTLIVLLVVVSLAFFLLTPEKRYENATPAQPEAATGGQKRKFHVDATEYPFESKWFDVDGNTVHYIDEGQGIPVVLCHGNPEWSFIYRNVIKEMAGECRLIAFDLPGYGFSTAADGFEFKPEAYAKVVEKLIIDHLGLEKFIIVVQDWGGPIGLTVATNHPDRVLGAVISNTWGWNVNGISKVFSNAMKTPILRRLVLNRNLFAKNMMVDLMNDKSKANPVITDAYLSPFPDAKSRIPTAEMPTQITRARAFLDHLDGKLAMLRGKPIELIFGTKDFALGNPKVQKVWQSRFPDAEVQFLPEANHFTQEDSPESFAISLRHILARVQ